MVSLNVKCNLLTNMLITHYLLLFINKRGFHLLKRQVIKPQEEHAASRNKNSSQKQRNEIMQTTMHSFLTMHLGYQQMKIQLAGAQSVGGGE